MATNTYRRYPTHRVNAFRPSADQPMSEMNTTPLIDVLLVLLVMIIITIPLRTHNMEVDLPSGESTTTTEATQISLTISPAGQVFWDGDAVNRAQLRERLANAAQLSPEPVIRFQPDPDAGYDASVQVIALVGDAGLRKFAFIGNEQFRSFNRD